MRDDVGNSGERMVAGTNDWGFYAHLSIYEFFSQYVRGKDILEIGSGTGYGANYLSSHAKSIVSLDVDTTANAFCREHSVSSAIDFRLHDLSEAPLPHRFEMLVSSNAMEHIPAIDSLLLNATKVLETGGKFLIAVPPVTSPGAYVGNFRNVFHINNLTPLNWYTKLSRYFTRVQCFRHWVSPEFEGEDRMPIGMSLPADQTVIRERDFVFQEMSAEALNTEDYCVTAVFIVSGIRDQVLPPSLGEELPRDWHIGKLCARVMQEEVARQAEVTNWYRAEVARLKAQLETEAAYYKGEIQRIETYTKTQVAEVIRLAAELHAAKQQREDQQT
jgi:SAM-dependent methyltransferase